MIIQVILIIFAVFVILKITLRFKERKISLNEFIFWLALWLVIGLVIWLPATATFFANLVGIGRGSDLAVYSAILLLFYLVFRIFVKLDDLEAQITKLVRREALERFKKESNKK